ncbi:MAG: MBOAT family O-acyltransferase [Pseudomonadota bacterium]
MLFNTQVFLLAFLPVALFGFYLLIDRPALRAWWLIGVSLYFYGYWEPRLLPLLVASILLNWLLAIAFVRWRFGWLLPVGIASNLALLGVFKYADFFASSLAAFTPLEHGSFNIILPLGISFFTFQQISYLADLSRGAAPRYGLREYALYVSFFPQLIAGPIVRHNQIIDQYALDPRRDGASQRVAQGVLLLVLGLAKKLLLADEAAEFADPIFAAVGPGVSVAPESAWIGLLAFTLQIYFDFSGYSDMAIGLALLFGLSLPVNFNAPYRAVSVSDFWRRWHITLSEFLRDYLYIPLGGNRHGQARLALALLATMLLGGLWHGAAWTFVGWGALHGLALVAAHGWRRTGIKCPDALGWVLTLVVVMAAWVLFRAPDFESAAWFYASLWPWHAGVAVTGLDSLWVLYVGALLATLGPTSQSLAHEWLRPRRWQAVATGVALTFLILAAGGLRSEEFIYFQF